MSLGCRGHLSLFPPGLPSACCWEEDGGPWGHLWALLCAPGTVDLVRAAPGQRCLWRAILLPCAPEGLCGRCPHPSVPVPEAAVVLGSCRVTQLLEHLSEAVEQSSLFDPEHPGLEEELESLCRHLEALSSSEPSSMETHFSNPAGRLCPACPSLPVQARMEMPIYQATRNVMARGQCPVPGHISLCRAGPAVLCPHMCCAMSLMLGGCSDRPVLLLAPWQDLASRWHGQLRTGASCTAS